LPEAGQCHSVALGTSTWFEVLASGSCGSDHFATAGNIGDFSMSRTSCGIMTAALQFRCDFLDALDRCHGLRPLLAGFVGAKNLVVWSFVSRDSLKASSGAFFATPPLRDAQVAAARPGLRAAAVSERWRSEHSSGRHRRPQYSDRYLRSTRSLHCALLHCRVRLKARNGSAPRISSGQLQL
jgi:hypothetical protein